MQARLYKVVKSVTGYEVGDLHPLKAFIQPDRLIELGVLVPTEFFTEFEDGTYDHKKNELEDELRQEIADLKGENLQLRAEIDRLKSEMKPKRKPKSDAAATPEDLTDGR
jgi:uncharacterized small protein (DUF1192 family)